MQLSAVVILACGFGLFLAGFIFGWLILSLLTVSGQRDQRQEQILHKKI